MTDRLDDRTSSSVPRRWKLRHRTQELLFCDHAHLRPVSEPQVTVCAGYVHSLTEPQLDQHLSDRHVPNADSSRQARQPAHSSCGRSHPHCIPYRVVCVHRQHGCLDCLTRSRARMALPRILLNGCCCERPRSILDHRQPHLVQRRFFGRHARRERASS